MVAECSVSLSENFVSHISRCESRSKLGGLFGDCKPSVQSPWMQDSDQFQIQKLERPAAGPKDIRCDYCSAITMLGKPGSS